MRLPLIVSPIAQQWAKILIRKPKMLHWYRHWKNSLEETKSPLSDGLPWITYEAIDWLESYLQPKMHVFEWGSGGSTLFFARRVGSVTVVEHDPEWHSAVVQSLHDRAFDNVRMLLHSPIAVPEQDIQFCSMLEAFVGFSFVSYVKAIDDYPDDYFDLVMVDGRARVSCVERAVKKIKPGGHLLLDNTEREKYLPAFSYMYCWRKKEFAGPVSNMRNYIARCIVWQKPK